MKKLLSTHYNAFSFNAAMLVLRLAMGVLMMSHGYDKLVHFNEKKAVFYNFLSLGSSTSLMLCIFAEFFLRLVCGDWIVYQTCIRSAGDWHVYRCFQCS